MIRSKVDWMKKTLLYKVAYLVEAEDGEISTNHGKEELRKMIWKALPDQDIAIDRSIPRSGAPPRNCCWTPEHELRTML